MTHIVLVEDDRQLAELVTEYLCKKGFAVDWVDNGVDAVRRIPQQQPDLVILDVMLPACSGMDVCQRIRPHYNGPILMFTALDDDMDQLLGLELGADDYVVKPVQPRLLLARINTLLRRMKPVESTISRGTLSINRSLLTATLEGSNLQLSSAEFELLSVLAEQAGTVVGRDEIMRKLRGFEYDGLDRSIDRRVSRLRNRLKQVSNRAVIKTVRGKGYQLCVAEDAEPCSKPF